LWSPFLSGRGSGFIIQMIPYLLDHHRVFNTGDDLHGRTNAAGAWMRKIGHLNPATALIAHFYINIGNPL
jgi:hypothetical protein